MTTFVRSAVVVLLASLVFGGCKSELRHEPQTFTFIVYPGATYQSQLTELTKRAHTLALANEPAPPTAIYDTNAPLDSVANFYVREYGYPGIAPDATNNLSAAKPQAYYRSGDLASDNANAVPVLRKLGVTCDTSKAQGTYRAVEIEALPNRPRVTIQRPYFDITKSQVIDRTIILMAR